MRFKICREYVKCSYHKIRQQTPTEEHKETLGGDLFCTLTVVMLLQAYAYVQTHQNIYVKCVRFFVYQKA